MKISKPSKQGVIRETKDYLMIALGMILYGIGWTLFLLPNDITTGGVPGIASIVYFATGFPVQYTYFAINAVLLMVSLKVLGFRFSLKTIFGVFTLTFFLSVIQKLTANVTLLHDQPFMACVLGASFCGSGIGIAFSANGSTGGTDIIAAVINKYRDITLGRVMLICDLIIISSSYFVLKDWEKVVYGYVTLYVCSFVLDQVVNSARQSVQFFIISNKYEEIGKRINEYPHRGVTIINATGFYTGKEQKMMFVLAKKRESTIIFRLISFTYRPFTLEGNFAFAAGIQEMLLQSHTGVIRIFPAIPKEWKDVSFESLRAMGAFLVSARMEGGEINRVRIYSEKGGMLKIARPGTLKPNKNYTLSGTDILNIDTQAGEWIELNP